MFNDMKLSSATGFCVKKNADYYLITNRHVVTGRDNNTEKVLHKESGIPNQIMIHLPKKTNHQRNETVWKGITKNLYNNKNDCNNDDYIWHEHPTLGKKADFVAIKLTETEIKGLLIPIYFLEHSETDHDILTSLYPSQGICVVGFPFNRLLA